jgi:hypothetical protein
MAIRYCPSCDLKGLPPYTMWVGQKDGLDDTEYCEHDSQMHNEHYTYMLHGEYWFGMCGVDGRCLRGCPRVIPFDDGVRCCQLIPAHLDLWQSLVDAMEKEAKQESPVAFDPETWEINFPRRTAEPLKKLEGLA